MSGCSSGATLKKRVEELAVLFLGRYCVFGLYFKGATLKQGMDNYHRRRNYGHGDRWYDGQSCERSVLLSLRTYRLFDTGFFYKARKENVREGRMVGDVLMKKVRLWKSETSQLVVTIEDTKVNFVYISVSRDYRLTGHFRRHHDLLAGEEDALAGGKRDCSVLLTVCVCFVTSIDRAVCLEELADGRILVGDFKY